MSAAETHLDASLFLVALFWRDFEPEVTAKGARWHDPQDGRRCRVYEVPISDSGRDDTEGKKIGLKDAFAALTGAGRTGADHNRLFADLGAILTGQVPRDNIHRSLIPQRMLLTDVRTRRSR
ncbi:MAG: hypothetical protein H7Z41_14720 [Cytophagales bacterium]|nr:hypothetical protein [Armatimonadota bacterium]